MQERLRQVTRQKISDHLECHELVIRFGGPGVDFDGRFHADDEELDSFVANDLEVDGTLQIAHIHPSISLLGLQGKEGGMVGSG